MSNPAIDDSTPPADTSAAQASGRDVAFEKQIDHYLNAHPEFLRDHWQLSDDTSSPGASSLSGRQIALLRQRNSDLHEKLQAMFSHASNNETISRSLFSLLSQLLRCRGIDEKLVTLREGLTEYFGIAECRIRLRPALDITGCDSLDKQGEDFFNDVIRGGKPDCSLIRTEQKQYLFGEQSLKVRTTALIPLGKQAHLGLAALGSEFPDQFTPDQDTLFLSILGDCCAAVLEGELRD